MIAPAPVKPPTNQAHTAREGVRRGRNHEVTSPMTEPSLADHLARRLAVLTALYRRVGDAIDGTRTRLATALTPGDSKKPTHPDDPRLRLATISYRAGSVSARITDRDALIEYLAEMHPEALNHSWQPVDTTTWREYREAYPGDRRALAEIDPTYEARLLAESKQAGEPCTPEGDLDIPGVKVWIGEPVLAVRPATDVPDHAWRSLMVDITKEVTDGHGPQD